LAIDIERLAQVGSDGIGVADVANSEYGLLQILRVELVESPAAAGYVQASE